MPNTVKHYVHRVGRTARAGRAGRSVSLVGEEERKMLKEIVKAAKAPVKARILPQGEQAPLQPFRVWAGRGLGQTLGRGRAGDRGSEPELRSQEPQSGAGFESLLCCFLAERPWAGPTSPSLSLCDCKRDS